MNMNINWKLPEDIVKIILSKLSFSNLPNCRIVCKAWNDLIVDYDFSSSKLHNAFILSTSDIDHNFGNAKVHCIDLNTASSVATLRFGDEINIVTVINSCNGLLQICKSTFHGWRYGIWNPMTNEFFQVPELEQVLLANGSGFGFSPKTKQYKLFVLFPGKESSTIVEVLRFGIGNEVQWSGIVGCHPTFSINGLGTYLDGFIYWIENNVIYGLDVETETFETIAILDFGPYSLFAYTRPFNDAVCVIKFVTSGNRQVWVMKAKHSWIKEFDIDLPISFQFFLIKAFEEEGKLYFVSNNDLFCFDKIKKVNKIKTLFNLNEIDVCDFLPLQSLNFGSLSKILGGND